MTSVENRSRQSLIDNIKYLETELSHLQIRLNLIVHWIRSQYYDLNDLPAHVAVAVRGNEGLSTEKNEIFKDFSHDFLEQNNVEEHSESEASSNVNKLDDEMMKEIECGPVSRLRMQLQQRKLAYLEDLEDNNKEENNRAFNSPAVPVREGVSQLPLLFVKLESVEVDDKEAEEYADENLTNNLGSTLSTFTISYNDIVENEANIGTSTSADKGKEGSNVRALDKGINKRVKKTAKHIEANRKKGLVLEASEYIKMVSQLPKERLACIVCNKKCSTSKQVKRHELEVHLTIEERNKVRRLIAENAKIEPSMCEICNKLFKNIEAHKLNHLRMTPKQIERKRKKRLVLDASEYIDMVSPLPKERLTCAVCNKEFSTSKQVKRHELEVHLTIEDRNKVRGICEENAKTEPSMCEICNKLFKNIETHKLNHLPPEVMSSVEGRLQYRCLKCGLLLPTKKSYLSHVIRDCKDEESLENSNYAQQQILRMKRTFLCNICGNVFKRKHSLQIHQLSVHAKKRDFKCQFCEKSFSTEYLKKCHEKKHLGISEVICDLCGFKFTCKQILRKHIKGVHQNDRPFQCQLCDKRFKTSHARNYHVNTHGNPNGRKRGLNREIDPIKAAAKRRHSSAFKLNRLQKVAIVSEPENLHSATRVNR